VELSRAFRPDAKVVKEKIIFVAINKQRILFIRFQYQEENKGFQSCDYASTMLFIQLSSVHERGSMSQYDAEAQKSRRVTTSWPQ
jgi:hypothetical protein